MHLEFLIIYMKIYTKTGDKGTTRLVDGSCVEKFNPRVEAYGTVDELNSAVGLLISFLGQKNSADIVLLIKDDLVKIQHWLFNTGSLLATENPEVRTKLPQINETQIRFLENRMDQMTASLPVLKNFILPGGDLTSSQAHVCRTVCRRAERRAAEVILPALKELDDPVLVFLNRLSDYFFTLARHLNQLFENPEVIWSKTTNG